LALKAACMLAVQNAVDAIFFLAQPSISPFGQCPLNV
jgi:hypothetical protein